MRPSAAGAGAGAPTQGSGSARCMTFTALPPATSSTPLPSRSAAAAACAWGPVRRPSSRWAARQPNPACCASAVLHNCSFRPRRASPLDLFEAFPHGNPPCASHMSTCASPPGAPKPAFPSQASPAALLCCHCNSTGLLSLRPLAAFSFLASQRIPRPAHRLSSKLEPYLGRFAAPLAQP